MAEGLMGISQSPEKASVKKRPAAPGTTRITITLQEDDYKALVEFAKNEMREPNNMLSYGQEI